jgi:putative thioredoxin
VNATPIVIDVSDDAFEREVIERSYERPVVVDFWAPWCGPCRTLGPLLERVTTEHGGAVILAKVDIDQSPRVAGAFGIRSIPAVIAFRDGKVASEFVGAQPESAVRAFFAALLPTEADRLAREGETLAAGGDAAAAEEKLNAALARDARHPNALLALARLYADTGRLDDALPLLGRLPPDGPLAREGDRLAAEIRTRRGAGDAEGDDAALRARLTADPADLDARLALGRLLAGRGDYEPALQELLEVVRRDRRHDDEAARKAMLDVFELLGARHPLAERYRSELARVLFS